MNNFEKMLHKGVLTVGVIFLIVGVGVALLPGIVGRAVEVTRTVTVPPLEIGGFVLHLKQGDVVEGYFTVRGGANNDIIFYIEDPKGNIIYKPAGRVYNYHEFKFTAMIDGEYFLRYDNAFSLVASKTIYLTGRVSPFGRFAWMRYLGGAMSIVGAAMIVIGIIIKPKPPSTPSPPTPTPSKGF
jgi:hypothetical protein